jgi:hypothetical protein
VKKRQTHAAADDGGNGFERMAGRCSKVTVTDRPVDASASPFSGTGHRPVLALQPRASQRLRRRSGRRSAGRPVSSAARAIGSFWENVNLVVLDAVQPERRAVVRAPRSRTTTSSNRCGCTRVVATLCESGTKTPVIPRPKWRNRQTRRIQNPVSVKDVRVRVPPSALTGAPHGFPAPVETFPHAPLTLHAPVRKLARLVQWAAGGAVCAVRNGDAVLRPASRANAADTRRRRMLVSVISSASMRFVAIQIIGTM